MPEGLDKWLRLILISLAEMHHLTQNYITLRSFVAGLVGTVFPWADEWGKALHSSAHWQDYIALGSFVVGLVGTVVAVAGAWVKELDASAQRIRILDEATKRALFWDTWSKGLANADPELSATDLRSKVKVEIAAAAQSVEDVYYKLAPPAPSAHVTVSRHREYRSSLSRVRRWFLLYKPPRWRAWIPRTFFYIYALEAPGVVFILWLSPAGTTVSSGLFSFFGMVMLALVFRWVSIWAEKPRAVSQGV